MLTMAKGFLIGAGMIIPIGAQNSYILTQSIKKNYHLMVATICVICDFTLMTLGVFGGGALVASNDIAYYALTIAGILFLTVYGAIFFNEFLKSSIGSIAESSAPSTRKAVLFTTLAVTLLNPHVYLDTVVIIGSISGQYQGSEKWWFWLGILMASLTWFYSLALAAAKMSPWLSKGKVQQGINLFVAVIMWSIAVSLVVNLL
ncbi:MAG: LysE/ArgO family amino acid transporter [Thalassotalea sp.]|nr:LysE/ArgO family amino acid transporter [Thalassotalea sp.]